MPAPIALFVYNRPDHLRRVLDALVGNPEARASRLFVYSDAPKSESAVAEVAQVRSQIRRISGFADVEIVEQRTNQGVARSVIAGVTDLTGRFGRVIVLEDDLLPSAHFLAYMNSALDLYADDEGVASIAGYFFPVQAALPPTFFLRMAECWGWGTWARAWSLFEPSGPKLLHELRRKGLRREFDFEGSHPFSRMLEEQIRGRNDSWAIRWYASVFLQDRLTLYPRSSQIQNIGTDGSGIHVAPTEAFAHSTWGERIEPARVPVRELAAGRRAFAQGLLRGRPPLLKRVVNRLTRVMFRGTRPQA